MSLETGIWFLAGFGLCSLIEKLIRWWKKQEEGEMDCIKCKTKMDYEDGIHRWNVRTWFCSECEYEVDEDITGDLIDYAKETR